MSIVKTDDVHYKNIANAIREKTLTNAKYKPNEIASGVNEVYEVGYTKGKEEGGKIPEYISGFTLRSDEELDNFEITLPETVTSLENMFAYTRKFKTITVHATGQNITSLRTAFAFFNIDRVVNIDFDTSKVKDWYRCFTRSGLGASSSDHTVNGVLDFSSATDLSNFTYNGTTGIYHFTVKSETIKVNMTLHVKVDDETMQSVLNGLANVGTARTLTIQSVNGETLTTDQIEVAKAKNWTISY